MWFKALRVRTSTEGAVALSATGWSFMRNGMDERLIGCGPAGRRQYEASEAAAGGW